MLIGLVKLRREGEKRPREEVLADTPLVGELQVANWPGRPPEAIVMFPWHGTAAPGTALPRLENARLRTIKADSMLLVGVERIGMHHERKMVPQAWWCRILPETERPAPGLPHPAASRPKAGT